MEYPGHRSDETWQRCGIDRCDGLVTAKVTSMALSDVSCSLASKIEATICALDIPLHSHADPKSLLPKSEYHGEASLTIIYVADKL